MNRKHNLSLIALLSVFVLSGYNCNDIFEDPGFDLWCDDQLCNWQLESGAVDRVSTWHQSDYGVELVGSDVAISQITDKTASCLRFELIANIEETAEVTIELDFFSDGSVEFEQRIPTASWEQLSFQARMPVYYDAMLLRIRKRGAGRAVLAEIAVLAEGDCAGLAPVAQFEGALCTAGSECVSGMCADSEQWLGACGSCTGAAECTQPGQVCGLETTVDSHHNPYPTCVDTASHGLGQRCHQDDECSTGICARDVCATCRDDSDCAPGVVCSARTDDLGRDWGLPPWQCAPRAMAALPGTACLSHDDCQSGVCQGVGERSVCLSDSRDCTQDSDCPPFLFGSSGDGAVCVTVGLADGVCQ